MRDDNSQQLLLQEEEEYKHLNPMSPEEYKRRADIWDGFFNKGEKNVSIPKVAGCANQSAKHAA